MTPARGSVPLARALSKLGIVSRTEAIALIQDGRVSVDGRVVRSPALPVVPERITVEIDGRPVGREAPVTIILHKPRGVVTTRRDPQGRPTVLDLVADAPARVFPVGRLDMATSGLLLLTNDHRFADWVTDPVNRVPRVYVATVRGEVVDAAIGKLEAGTMVCGELLQGERIDVRKRSRRETHLVIQLTEGKNREIRRMLQSIGHEVTRLKRVAFGGLTLGSLTAGRWRAVTDEELTVAFPGAPIRRRSLKSRPAVR